MSYNVRKKIPVPSVPRLTASRRLLKWSYSRDEAITVMKQETLFPETKAGSESLAPEDSDTSPHFITEADERALVGEMINLPLKPFEFHPYFGNRRIISFGFATATPASASVPGAERLSFVRQLYLR
jgi:hypothetical protein